LLFFPYLLGERTLGRETSRGSFVGLTLDHGRGHLVRAVLEGVCLENRRALDLIAPPDQPGTVRCIGGGSASALWNQIRADVYDRAVRVLEHTEGGITGAALLAGVGAGWYPDAAQRAEQFGRLGAEWRPDAVAVERYRARYGTFCAVHDSLDQRWASWDR
jgi:xylulokinase